MIAYTGKINLGSRCRELSPDGTAINIGLTDRGTGKKLLLESNLHIKTSLTAACRWDEDDQFGLESSSTKSNAPLVANSLQADEIDKRTKVEDSYKPTKRASVLGPFAECCLPIGGV